MMPGMGQRLRNFRKGMVGNEARFAGIVTVGVLLTVGVPNMLLGWPAWESWVERAVGVFLLASMVLVRWSWTSRGRAFGGSVLLGVYRAEGGIAGVERFVARGSRKGHGPDFYLLGNLLDGLGDRTGADAAYRRAADVGHGPAMSVVGRGDFARGDYEGAERWLRQARAAGVEDVEPLLTEASRRRALATDLDAS